MSFRTNKYIAGVCHDYVLMYSRFLQPFSFLIALLGTRYLFPLIITSDLPFILKIDYSFFFIIVSFELNRIFQSNTTAGHGSFNHFICFFIYSISSATSC